LKGLILYVKKKIGKVPEGIMRSQIARPKNNDHNNKNWANPKQVGVRQISNPT